MGPFQGSPLSRPKLRLIFDSAAEWGRVWCGGENRGRLSKSAVAAGIEVESQHERGGTTMTANKTLAEVRTAAAEALEARKDYSGDICVMYEGTNASSPTMIYGRNGWTSTPFQNANGGPLAVAGWLWSQGGCCSYIADLHSDGSATVYEVDFAAESDEDSGTVAGQPVDVTTVEEVSPPAEDSEEE